MQVTLVVREVDPQTTPSETLRKIPCAGSFTIRRDVFDLVSGGRSGWLWDRALIAAISLLAFGDHRTAIADECIGCISIGEEAVEVGGSDDVSQHYDYADVLHAARHPHSSVCNPMWRKGQTGWTKGGLPDCPSVGYSDLL
jgi:hypothetical protein